MKVKAKLRELVDLSGAVSRLMATQHLVSPKFSYGIMRNAKMLKDILYPYNELSKVPEGVYEYEQERVPMVELFAEKDANGNFVYVDSQSGMRGAHYKIDPKKKGDFEKRLNELREKYKKDLDAMNDNRKKQSEMLDIEDEFELYGINESEFPKELPMNILGPLNLILIADGGGEIIPITKDLGAKKKG